MSQKCFCLVLFGLYILGKEDVYFDLELQRYVFGQLRVDKDVTDIYFIDEDQTIRYETWTQDGYVVSKNIKIKDKREYFKRKLIGE